MSQQLPFILNKVLLKVPGPVFSDFKVLSADIYLTYYELSLEI